MKFEYTGRHIEVTPALRSHVEEQFGKLGHLFNGDALSAHVIIGLKRQAPVGNRAQLAHDVLTANTVIPICTSRFLRPRQDRETGPETEEKGH